MSESETVDSTSSIDFDDAFDDIPVAKLDYPWSESDSSSFGNQEIVYASEILPVTKQIDEMWFGVEIEFGIWVSNKWVGSEILDGEELDDKFRELLVVDALEADGIPCTLDPINPPESYRMYLSEKLATTHWKVEADESVEPDDDDRDRWEEQHFVNVEVSSPPLPFTESSLEQVKRVIEILRGSIPGAIMPSSAGLHVHISNGTGADDEFSLKTLKNLATLASVATFQLLQLHSLQRAQSPYAVNSLSQFHYAHPRDVIEQIDQITDRTELIDRMHRANVPADWKGLGQYPEIAYLIPQRRKYMAINLMNTIGKLRTVEFRGHAGTFNVFEVIRWIKTCVGIISACSAPNNIMVELVAAIAKPDPGPHYLPSDDWSISGRRLPQTSERMDFYYDLTYSISDMFQDMGLVDLAEMWKGAREHDPNDYVQTRDKERELGPRFHDLLDWEIWDIETARRRRLYY